MANQTPSKKWASRMGGVMRRASTALISPARPGTPDQGERTSTDIDREDDAASTTGKKPKKSRSNTSLSNLFTRSTTPPPLPAASATPAAPQQPSPIAESPSREAAASQEEIAAPAAAKSPLSQEVTPADAADPQAVVTSPTAGGYVAPPLEEDTSNPGAFTDDVDDLPSSDPIPDPYAQPAAEEDAASAPRQQSPLPIERAPSDASQQSEPSVIPTAQNSTDLLVSSGGEQEDKSAPIPIPQKQGTFFEYIRSSPEDEDEVPPPPPSKQQPQQQTPPQPQTQLPTIIPIPIPIVTSPSQQGQQVPRTPPRQVDLDMYTSEHEPWSQHSVEETPMSIPTRPVARSLTSRSDSSEDIPVTSRSIENPFDDPVAPRLPPSHPQHGNGNMYSSSSDNRAAMMSMPTALVPGNSKAKSVQQPKFLGNPKPYGADSDSDESQPLIRSGKTPKTGNSSSYGFTNPITEAPGRYGTFEQHEYATPPRLRENGWVEIHLPDSYVYYVNPSARVVADVEMRNDRLFNAVMRHLEMEQHKDAVEGAAEGAELWLRDAGSIKKGFIPVRWWVDHKERSVVFDKAFDVAIKRRALKKKKEDEDQLDLEYRYWAFVEAHPSHVTLEPRAKQEAYEAINWAMTERLLPSQSPIPAPFTQEECGTLLDLLKRFDDDKDGRVDTAIQTRTIARILLRVAQWRQQHFRPNKLLPKDVTAKTATAPIYRRAFPRVLVDFTISCLCLGIPYFFLDRSRDHRVDEESGLRTAAPMFVIGACTCIMASIILSASVTFLTLSGLDSVMRIAGFVALVSAIFSMASTLLAIFTIKADLERPPQVIGGEGLLMLSKRSVVMSLPVVFLLYSIIGFVTGVVLFSLRGVSITDVHLVRRPLNEYTRWTAAGALGAIAGMFTISFLLFKR